MSTLVEVQELQERLDIAVRRLAEWVTLDAIPSFYFPTIFEWETYRGYVHNWLVDIEQAPYHLRAKYANRSAREWALAPENEIDEFLTMYLGKEQA